MRWIGVTILILLVVCCKPESSSESSTSTPDMSTADVVATTEADTAAEPGVTATIDPEVETDTPANADVASCVNAAFEQFPGLAQMSVNDPAHRQESLDMGLYENSQRGDLKCVDLLVAKGANVEGPFFENGQLTNYSPLAIAAMKGNSAIARVLLKHGANPRLAWNGTTPLHFAARGGSVAIVNELLGLGVDVNACASESNFTPLFEASAQCKTDVVKILLAKGAKNIPAKGGGTPLDTAVAHKCTDTSVVLLKAFPN